MTVMRMMRRTIKIFTNNCNSNDKYDSSNDNNDHYDDDKYGDNLYRHHNINNDSSGVFLIQI